VINHITSGAVGARDIRILTKGECTKDSGDDRGVVGDVVEPGAVGAIIHGIEDDFELDPHIRGRHGLDHYGNEVLVVSVEIGVNETAVSQWGRFAIRDRGGRIYGRPFSTGMKSKDHETYWAEGQGGRRQTCRYPYLRVWPSLMKYHFGR
jgi:hypothetical protein